MQPLQHHHQDAPEVHKPKKRANKYMATERGLYSTIILLSIQGIIKKKIYTTAWN